MIRRTLAILGTLTVVALGVLIAPSSATATVKQSALNPSACVGGFVPSWQQGATWGRAWICAEPFYGTMKGETDDILTDGECVYIRFLFTGETNWATQSHVIASQSCGPPYAYNYCYPEGEQHCNHNSFASGGVRLYRTVGGDYHVLGNYFTLSFSV